MYRIIFYEDGRFITFVGGEIRTLSEALGQIQRLSEGLNAENAKGFVGVKFDRNGTPCAIIVADRWGMPIKNEENYEE